jgi:hypothetical protein
VQTASLPDVQTPSCTLFADSLLYTISAAADTNGQKQLAPGILRAKGHRGNAIIQSPRVLEQEQPRKRASNKKRKVQAQEVEETNPDLFQVPFWVVLCTQLLQAIFKVVVLDKWDSPKREKALSRRFLVRSDSFHIQNVQRLAGLSFKQELHASLFPTRFWKFECSHKAW